MTDPVQTTQQTSDAVTATGALGLVGVILGAITALWRTVFGSKAERADANERAAELALRAAEHADERAERADESHRMALGTCEEQLRAMRAEIRLMRADLDALRAENTKLRRDQEIARGMLADLMRNASTPPSGLYVPDDVRAAMAAAEDTGP